MVQMVLGVGVALMSCSAVFAGWEPASIADHAANLPAQSVKSSDPRGNTMVMYKDLNGTITGYLLLNAFLPEPEQVGGATPVIFSVDGKDAHVIKEGGWETEGVYRKLMFTVSGSADAGLSESLIDIMEGDQVTFRYPAGLMGYQAVNFSLKDPAGVVARAFDIVLPIDHEKENRLRETHLSMEVARKAALMHPVDPETERARQNLIARQLDAIRERVISRWMRPAHWSGLRCTLQITLMSTGKVLRVAVINSSGDPGFDASMTTAVWDASPLPLPADKTLFGGFQQFEMTFDPVVNVGATESNTFMLM